MDKAKVRSRGVAISASDESSQPLFDIREDPTTTENHNEENQNSLSCGKKTKRLCLRELWSCARVSLKIFKGEASPLVYLLIPTLIALAWILLMFVTVRSPSLSLEERLAQEHLKKYFEPKVYQEGVIITEEFYHEEHFTLPEGESVNIVIAMPFLDVNPLGASEYISTLEWVLFYSSVPVKFHIITNADSAEYIEKLVSIVNKTTKAEFSYELVTLAHIMDEVDDKICPQLGAGEEFCDILVGRMTPMLFPYIFPHLDHLIFMDRQMVFQEDVLYLYQQIKDLQKSKQSFALAHEQSNKYMRAFAGWQRVNPSTKLGRPLPEGKPGFNVDLILMDLAKLRASAAFKAYLSEQKFGALVKTYVYHATAEIPDLGDFLNLIAADSHDKMVKPLDCAWNRRSSGSADQLDKMFNICPDCHRVKAWNGQPDSNQLSMGGDKSVSFSKTIVKQGEHLVEELL